MPENMTRAEMKAQIMQHLAYRRKQSIEERKKFGKETEALFPIIHKNHEEAQKK